MCSDTSEECEESDALVKTKDPGRQSLEVMSSGQQPAEHAAWLKWASLGLLVFQNSGIFLMMRYTRSVDGPLYMTTVTVWLSEFFKAVVCSLILVVGHLRGGGGCGGFAAQVYEEIWVQRWETLRLGVPAVCYTIQNNLLFLAVTHMSAAGSQVLYQSKTLSTALFSVTLLGKRFKAMQWVSFLLLAVGVALVQNQDSKWASGKASASPVIGAVASIVAAGLSGFAGVYLELMFTRGSTSIWMRNVQLTLFTLPLQTLTVYQSDHAHIARHGLLHGFYASTWAVVGIQVAGGLIVAVVIKYAGNILKTFAAVLAILVTCLVSYLLPQLGFVATPLFGLGVTIVILSIVLYSRPPNVACCDDD